MERRTIVGFELGFPDTWHLVPRSLADPQAWARATAAELLPAPPGERPDARAEDVAQVLAEQLADVVGAVTDTGISGLQAAVLVRHPESGVVDAMLTMGAQRGVSAGAFTTELEQVVATSQEHDFVYAGAVEGVTHAGPAAGLHAIISHPGDVEGSSGVLEERVVIGVFPTGTEDIVEVTAVARSVGTFDDLPQELLDLLAGLTVETVPA